MIERLYRSETTPQWWLSWRGFEFFGSWACMRPCLPAIDLPIISLSRDRSFDDWVLDWVNAAQNVVISNQGIARARFEPLTLLSVHDTAAYAAAHDAYWATKPKYWTELYDLLTVQQGTYGT